MDLQQLACLLDEKCIMGRQESFIFDRSGKNCSFLLVQRSYKVNHKLYTCLILQVLCEQSSHLSFEQFVVRIHGVYIHYDFHQIMYGRPCICMWQPLTAAHQHCHLQVIIKEPFNCLHKSRLQELPPPPPAHSLHNYQNSDQQTIKKPIRNLIQAKSKLLYPELRDIQNSYETGILCLYLLLIMLYYIISCYVSLYIQLILC